MNIEKSSYRTWRIESDSGNNYIVTLDDKGYKCTCPYSAIKNRTCKHIRAVRSGMSKEE